MGVAEYLIFCLLGKKAIMTGLLEGLLFIFLVATTNCKIHGGQFACSYIVSI